MEMAVKSFFEPNRASFTSVSHVSLWPSAADTVTASVGVVTGELKRFLLQMQS
jgi:hypothetical protein